ncbi:MAG: ADP-ribosylglycohydrolase family protein [Clostridia bacterium]|nr:ADP-ribosylglycohydrolase family protein [Clostridia bacterium]
MLEHQAWMKLAPDMMIAWQQAMDEGKNAEKFQASCEMIAKESKTQDREKEAEAMEAVLLAAPVRPDYPYQEPSDYAGIVSTLPEGEEAKKDVFIADLREHIAGAWIGRIAGCLLGKPLEGLRMDKILPILQCTGNYPMNRYVDSREFTEELRRKVDFSLLEPWQKCWVDTIGDAAPVDDDTNYTVFALKIVQKYGRNFRSCDVLEGWLQWIPMFATCTAERVAYRNGACGLLPPGTAFRKNPYREWIGAQIRGDFFGYINPGNPRRAAEMAFRDASISHVKNGIYGEMYIAAMIAKAAVCGEPMEIIKAGLREIPPRSRLHEAVERVIGWYEEKISWDEVEKRIHGEWNEWIQHHWCHTVSNAMIVTAAILWGEGDFGKSICQAVQIGFDTDCNGATVGSILGMMLGKEKIPASWSKAFHERLRTSIDGFPVVSVEQLAEMTCELIRTPS